MLNKKNLSLSTAILFFVLAGVSIAAWTAPTVAPPEGNMSEPINVGTLEQTKSGNLIIGGGMRVGTSGTAGLGNTGLGIENGNLVIARGNLVIATGAGAGFLLVSDAAGKATWASPSSINLGSGSGTTAGLLLVSDGAGSATWQSPSSLGLGTGGSGGSGGDSIVSGDYSDVTSQRGYNVEYTNGSSARLAIISLGFAIGSNVEFSIGSTSATTMIARTGGSPSNGGNRETMTVIIPPNYKYKITGSNQDSIYKWVEKDLSALGLGTGGTGTGTGGGWTKLGATIQNNGKKAIDVPANCIDSICEVMTIRYDIAQDPQMGSRNYQSVYYQQRSSDNRFAATRITDANGGGGGNGLNGDSNSDSFIVSSGAGPGQINYCILRDDESTVENLPLKWSLIDGGSSNNICEVWVSGGGSGAGGAGVGVDVGVGGGSGWTKILSTTFSYIGNQAFDVPSQCIDTWCQFIVTPLDASGNPGGTSGKMAFNYFKQNTGTNRWETFSFRGSNVGLRADPSTGINGDSTSHDILRSSTTTTGGGHCGIYDDLSGVDATSGKLVLSDVMDGNNGGTAAACEVWVSGGGSGTGGGGSGGADGGETTPPELPISIGGVSSYPQVIYATETCLARKAKWSPSISPNTVTVGFSSGGGVSSCRILNLAKSIDGGATWPNVWNDTPIADTQGATVIGSYQATASDIHILYQYRGNNTGSSLITTTDGGATWASGLNQSNENSMDLYANGSTVYVSTAYASSGRRRVYSSKVYKSTNSGASFTPVYDNVETTNGDSPLPIAGISATELYVLTSGVTNKLIYTNNGGTSWTTKNTTMPGLTSLHAINTNTLIGYGDGGNIYKSSNGGTSWTTQAGPECGGNFFVHDANTFFLTCSGPKNGASVIVARSTDGGTAWSYKTIDSYGGSGLVKIIDADNVYVIYTASSFNDRSNYGTPYHLKFVKVSWE